MHAQLIHQGGNERHDTLNTLEFLVFMINLPQSNTNDQLLNDSLLTTLVVTITAFYHQTILTLQQMHFARVLQPVSSIH